jgi:hypothetical protein
MSEQFENPQETNVEEATVIVPSAKEKIEHVAEKAAQKSTKRVQHFDKDHGIFTK